MTEHDRVAHDNDPNNWIVIPEFGAVPHELGFKGFGYSIAETVGLDSWLGRDLHRTVANVRTEARQRFKSQSKLYEAIWSWGNKFSEAVDRPSMSADVEQAARSITARPEDETFAKNYITVTFGLQRCLIPGDQQATLQYLAAALAALSDFAADSLPDRAMFKRALFQVSQRGGDVKNMENRAMKGDVFKWLTDNFHERETLDWHVETMMKLKLVPVTRDTVRKWTTNWNKDRKARAAK